MNQQQQQQSQQNPMSATVSAHQTTIHYIQNTTVNNIKHLKQQQKANRLHKSSIFLPSTNHNFQNINDLTQSKTQSGNSSIVPNTLSLPRADSAVKSKEPPPASSTSLSIIKDSPGLTLYAYLLKNNTNNDSTTNTQQQPQQTTHSSRSQNPRKNDNLEMRHVIPRLHRFNNASNQVINNAVVYNTDNYLRSIVQLTESEVSELNETKQSNSAKSLVFNGGFNQPGSNEQLSTSRSSQINQFKFTTSKLNSNQIF